MFQTIATLVIIYAVGYLAVWAERAQKLGRRGGRVGAEKWPLLVVLLVKMYLRRERS